MEERRDPFWRWLAVLASAAYIVGLAAPWERSCYLNDDRKADWSKGLKQIVTGCNWNGANNDIGVASLAVCSVLLVFLFLEKRGDFAGLAAWRTPLAVALLILTILNALIRAGFGVLVLTDAEQLGFGAFLALGSSLVILIAIWLLAIGGIPTFVDRIPEWLRFDRLEVSDESDSERGIGSAK